MNIKTLAGRHVYALAALPADLLTLFAVPLGSAGWADRMRRDLARRLLGKPVSPEPRSPSRVLGRALTGLLVDLPAFALVAAAWGVFLTRGVFYPLFGADHLERSWGGPSLAGAWFMHFIQGPPLLLLVTLVLSATTRASVR